MSSVIGFDYGEKRIGVAVGIIEIGTASPLTTIKIPESGIPWDQIQSIIKEWKPNKLIVGSVTHQTQYNNHLQDKIKRFCKGLELLCHLPIETTDESYTSMQAYDVLKDMRSKGQRKRIKKTDIDKASAAIILNNWLTLQNTKF